ncbi:hypothetical protein O181_002829 [Austropuccinia psidii MF-1]|uniref:Uncharacterized protein n=1 Tax=Austropuccinia psidii MF-1 TaxID=1389203 RepID=A0A9Q3BD68_9BASI|nr:hypothetical protein [Austropuccinia psidii MF-1]
MKLNEFRLQPLELESEMEHMLNDLQTSAYYSQNFFRKLVRTIQPIADLQRGLQLRRDKFINEGYLSRVKIEFEDAAWVMGRHLQFSSSFFKSSFQKSQSDHGPTYLEILWPRGRLLDIPGEDVF